MIEENIRKLRKYAKHLKSVHFTVSTKGRIHISRRIIICPDVDSAAILALALDAAIYNQRDKINQLLEHLSKGCEQLSVFTQTGGMENATVTGLSTIKEGCIPGFNRKAEARGECKRGLLGFIRSGYKSFQHGTVAAAQGIFKRGWFKRHHS